MTHPTRDLMAPDTDPTEEELAAAAETARNLIAERRAVSDAWVAARLDEALRTLEAERRARTAGSA